jgi:hypothetical protein
LDRHRHQGGVRDEAAAAHADFGAAREPALTPRRRRLELAGAIAAVVLAAGFLYSRWRGMGPEPASEAELNHLEMKRNGLREKLAELRAKDPGLKEAPAGSVLIGVPVEVATDLVRQFTAEFLDQVEIDLRGIKVHKEGEVTAKTFLGTMKPGAYVVDVTLDEGKGRLKPGKATLKFEGNRIQIALPVTVAEGTGRATIRFKFDSKGMAGAICDDLDLTHTVSGSVAPESHVLEGSFLLAVEDGVLEATPDFPDLGLRLKIEPSAETWASIDKLVGERGFKCRTALKMVNIRGVLKDLLDRGFDVKVPKKVIRPIRLPAGLQASVLLEGKKYDLFVMLQELRVVSNVLWYGADVSASVAAAPAGAAPEAPAQTP